MAKAKITTAPALSFSAPTRHRRVLILPKFLYSPDPQQNVAEQQYRRETQSDFDAAHAILKKWADMESKGRLKKKEISLDANFLNDVFFHALGYTPVEHANEDGSFTLDRQLTVPNVGPVDGALGPFPTDKDAPKPIAVIELKGSDTDLDTDKSNGRTAVQQLFDYLNGLPDTKWGIVSNFSTIRLYHKDRGSQAFEEFSLQKLAHDLDHFKAFWCLLETGGLIPTAFNKIPRADKLLTETGERQKEVGGKLYDYYSVYRNALIATLRDDFAKPLDEAVRISQKIFDRIIFVAFCEDRGLIKQKSIKRAREEIPAFHKVKNPRWQNFVGLFHGIDKGHPSLEISHGYNGGLFAEDKAIDDLELPDEPWTTVFEHISDYDFKDEVNVDVLGHIFEKSITELEKLRVTGLFSKDALTQSNGTNGKTANGHAPKPKMQKSAERKRFGIYYTPPEFTRFIVKHTVEELVLDRFKNLEKAHGVTPEELAADYSTLSPRLQAYYRHCLTSLRNFKIVDPACGSGAFLIAAYELLEDLYLDLIRHLAAQGESDIADLRDQIPDFILKENLYGVDLSEEAVEITRLALWIRSARPGKTLADLTHNVVAGNSLVDDKAVHPRAMNWQATFPEIFARVECGFDAVIGNPPWERIALKNREFFAFTAPEVLEIDNAAESRRRIENLKTSKPELYALYNSAKTKADRTIEYLRNSGKYPLAGVGDVNTYSVFAELASKLVARGGIAGLLVPSGIAFDHTTREFFAYLVHSERLTGFFDFENKKGIFEDVHRSYRFAAILIGGTERKTREVKLSFFNHSINDLQRPNAMMLLSARDIKLFNPNSQTCPTFSSKKDCEVARKIYRRIPILHRTDHEISGNTWGISFCTVFHQSSDAEVFTDPKSLKAKGFQLGGNVWSKGKQQYLPLYEAKMFRDFDHRLGTVFTKTDNWVNQGQTYETTPAEHQDPEHIVQPRWWAKRESVDSVIGKYNQPFLLAFRNVARATDTRTMIASFLPYCGVIHSAPLIFLTPDATPRSNACFLGNVNAHVFDFLVRQKIGGINLSYFIVEQIPTVQPQDYADKAPWTKKQTLEQWISERVLKLSCTAIDMIPLAQACNFNLKGESSGIPYVWKWKESERADLRAQLDAAYFHLYGLSREDAAYILSTFQTSGASNEGKTIAPRSPADQILHYYDHYQTH